MESNTDSKQPLSRVFISYSKADRTRVDGLHVLLDYFGHKVFLDYKGIRLGSQWEDELRLALDQTDVMLVYWTRSASSSKWVKDEYTYALTHYPDRPLIPIKGDETPLTEPLEARQGLTFVPVINELLDLKRKMEADGRKKAEIQAAIRNRLEEAGIRLEKSDENRVFRFFGITGWLAWLPAPLALLKWVWHSLSQATAQLSPAQVVLMAIVGTGTAALTHQADARSALAREAELTKKLQNAHESSIVREQEGKAREKGLANQLQEARNASIVREREGKSREAGLANQLQEAQNSLISSVQKARETQSGLANQLQESRKTVDVEQRRLRDIRVNVEKQLIELIKWSDVLKKFASDSVLQIEKFDKPVLLTFIDLKTKRPHFTVQLPGQQDFRLGIPKGSYQIQFVSTDVSPKINQVIGDDVQGNFSHAEFERGQPYVYGEVIGKQPVGPIPRGKFGQVVGTDKK
jgi:TIR domain